MTDESCPSGGRRCGHDRRADERLDLPCVVHFFLWTLSSVSTQHHYGSVSVSVNAPFEVKRDEPQTTLVADVSDDEPQTTLKPLLTVLPQTIELPHTTELPDTFAPQTTDDPQTTEEPQTTDEEATVLLPFDRVTAPVEELYAALGDRAEPAHG